MTGRILRYLVPTAGTVIRVSLVVIVVCIVGLFGPQARGSDTTPSSGPGRGLEHRSYMAFGDSVTYGLGTSDPATKSYPAQAHLRGVGVPGACLLTCLYPQWLVFDWWPAELDDDPAADPKVAVWSIGLNDLGWGHTDRQITRALLKLRRVGADRGIRVVYGTIIPPPHAGQGGNSDKWAAINPQRKRINQWIRAHSNGPDYSAALTCGSWLCPEYISPAWVDVHINDRGAHQMARALDQWIEADQ